MFLRLLTESFRRQKRRKALAAAAILLGTTAVTAMLALATTIGDRIHRELAVYGANIVVTPKADTLDVNIGGQNLKPATGNTYLHEQDLARLQTIFWHNNITAVSPELQASMLVTGDSFHAQEVPATGVWFNHPFSPNAPPTGFQQLHPSVSIEGSWPKDDLLSDSLLPGGRDILVGKTLATRLNLHPGDSFTLSSRELDDFLRKDFHDGIPKILTLPTYVHVAGIISSGDVMDSQLIVPLDTVQFLKRLDGSLSRIEIAARTRPEDAFARRDPDSLSPKQRDLWYCRPYANSIAYQIQEAIPNSTAQQVRKVEQSEGTVLSRISGLMWLISAAALLAAGFAVSAAMATAVLERRTEIGLMRSLGSSRAKVAALFYSESAILAAAAGTLGFFAGSALAWFLGRSIFPNQPTPLFNPVLLPAILSIAILVAIAGSTPAIRSALNANPSQTLRNAD